MPIPALAGNVDPESTDILASELKTAFRSGAIASVGPSLAVVIVAISLLALFGTPAVLVRIGLIGSAAFETGAGWILATLLFTPILRRGSAKLSEVNPVVLTVIPAAAVLGAFAGLTFGELAKTTPNAPVIWITTGVSAAVMLLLSLAGPAWLYFFTDLGVTGQQILTAWLSWPPPSASCGSSSPSPTSPSSGHRRCTRRS